MRPSVDLDDLPTFRSGFRVEFWLCAEKQDWPKPYLPVLLLYDSSQRHVRVAGVHDLAVMSRVIL